MTVASQTFSEYLQRKKIDQLLIISPHLDDAAFSLAATLQLPQLPATEVITIFTEARLDSDASHAHAMGFANPVEEFEARRKEDAKAMDMLGVSYSHLGAETDRFNPEHAESITEELRSRTRGKNPLILLPAGAGGTLSKAHKLWRRLTRTPPGCPPHADHENVRDAFTQSLGQKSVMIGYYGDIPYLWADSEKRLRKMLMQSDSRINTVVRIKPEPDKKLTILKAYDSQFAAEFGQKADYQRRTAAIAETLFLPG